MADKARIDEALNQLNELLGDVTPYKLAVVDPNEVKHVDKNAHYMPKQTFDRLVQNIEMDRNLSSLPFCWKNKEGVFICLSGNHRLDAARKAKVPLIMILYTDAKMSKSQQTAIQLSHNALVGADNTGVLVELWKGIDTIELKQYSGLDDVKLHTLEPVAIPRLNEAALRLETITLTFTAPEVEKAERVMQRLKSSSGRIFIAHIAEFEPFFEALLRFKDEMEVVNTSTAFAMMVQVCEQYLDDRAKVVEPTPPETTEISEHMRLNNGDSHHE